MAGKKARKGLVKDITPKKDTNEPLSSYKDQLAFGKKAYKGLMKDISPRKDTDEPLSSYKDQLGFGNDHLCNSLDLNGGRDRGTVDQFLNSMIRWLFSPMMKQYSNPISPVSS